MYRILKNIFGTYELLFQNFNTKKTPFLIWQAVMVSQHFQGNVNLTIAEWGLFWPRNTLTAHNFFTGSSIFYIILTNYETFHIQTYSVFTACILESKWDLGFFVVKKDPTVRLIQVVSLCCSKVNAI